MSPNSSPTAAADSSRAQGRFLSCLTAVAKLMNAIVNESRRIARRCRIGTMRSWTPQALYDAKPWVLIGVGAILAVGMMLWSLSAGLWTVWRGLLCFAGAGFAIVGGATLQMRQDYRAKSKWRRDAPP
jgi:hypothetical protein